MVMAWLMLAWLAKQQHDFLGLTENHGDLNNSKLVK